MGPFVRRAIERCALQWRLNTQMTEFLRPLSRLVPLFLLIIFAFRRLCVNFFTPFFSEPLWLFFFIASFFSPFLFRIYCRSRTLDCTPQSLQSLRTASFSGHTCCSASCFCAVKIESKQKIQRSAKVFGLLLRETVSQVIKESNYHSPTANRANHVLVWMSVTQKAENFLVVTTNTNRW